MIMGQSAHITITTEYLKLEQFLKLADLVSSGGEARFFLKTHDILINGEKEDRRGRKLYPGDTVEVDGEVYGICR